MNVNPGMPPVMNGPQWPPMPQQRPGMGLYVAACILHLLFCLYTVLVVGFEAFEVSSKALATTALLIGMFSSLLFFVGLRVYCKARQMSAPCTLLVIAQLFYIVVFVAIMFVPVKSYGNVVLLGLLGILLIVGFLLMLIGRFIVGGKLMAHQHPLMGLLVMFVAISQILFFVMGFIHSAEMRSYSYDAFVAAQRLGVVSWIYLIVTCLESLVALVMFSKNK